MPASVKSWLSYWTVYVDNLSLFYIISILVSFVAVFVSLWYHKKSSNENEKLQESESSDLDEEEKKSEKNPEDVNLMGEIRRAHHNAVEQKILSTFTSEQLEEERKIEKEQLAAIFKLLNQEKEKFQVDSMEELENQFKLYRP